MDFFSNQKGFLFTILGAVVVKLLTSTGLTFRQGCATAFTAVFCAIVFTDPLLALLNLDGTVFRSGLAAIIALTGDGLVRYIIKAANNPETLFDSWVKRWFGRKE